MHVNTAAGRVGIAFLGKTLMHEHLVASLPGWESNTLVEPSSFREMTAVCVDKIAELQGAGFSSLLDPCPNDIGRDVRLEKGDFDHDFLVLAGAMKNPELPERCDT